MSKTLGQHHMVFCKNHLAILPNMAIMYVSLCVGIYVFAPVRIYACVYVYAIIHSFVRIKVLCLILCLIDI